MKKILFCLFFFIFSGSVFAVQDTLVKNDQMYFTYFVKATDNYQKIANKFAVDIDQLKIANDNVRLYLRLQILIPIASTQQQRLRFELHQNNPNLIVQKDTLNMAILLPFYANLNSNNKQVDERSAMALSFLEGVILACDSLQKLNKPVNLSFYDTKNDTNEVRKLLKSGVLQDIDLIVGPVFTKNLSIVAKEFGNKEGKTLVSPLSTYDNVLQYGENIYQVIPTLPLQIETMENFVNKRFPSGNIFIVTHKKEKELAEQYHKFFLEKHRTATMLIAEELHENRTDKLLQLVGDNDIVLMPSTDEEFVMQQISCLDTIRKNIKVFGLHKWITFENVQLESFKNLQIFVPDPYYYSYVSNQHPFYIGFTKKFNFPPDKYACIAFFEVMYFAFSHELFMFEQSNTKGWINKRFPIVKFSNNSVELVN